MIAEKAPERFDPFVKAVVCHPVVIQVAPAEMPFHRPGVGLTEIDFHEDNNGFRFRHNGPRVSAVEEIQADSFGPCVLR